MNRLLSRDLRERQRDSDTFLLLEKLFNRAWFDGLPKGEQAMVTEIVANARSLREFIAANAKRSEEHTSELQSLMRISYAVVCLKKKDKTIQDRQPFIKPTN